MKTIGKIVRAQFSECLQSERTAAALLLGAGMTCYYASRYLRYANTAGLTVHPLDSFIISGSTAVNFTCITLFSVFLLNFDAPFLSERSVYEMARVGKGRWLRAKLLFLALEVPVYELFLAAVAALLAAFAAKSVCWFGWSQAMERLTNTAAASASAPYFYFPSLTTCASPWTAAGATVLLNGAYFLTLTLIMLLGNILLGVGKGWIAAAGVHIVCYVIRNNGGFLFSFSFSLLDCAFPAYALTGESAAGLLTPALVFAAVLTVAVVLARRAEERLLQ